MGRVSVRVGANSIVLLALWHFLKRPLESLSRALAKLDLDNGFVPLLTSTFPSSGHNMVNIGFVSWADGDNPYAFLISLDSEFPVFAVGAVDAGLRRLDTGLVEPSHRSPDDVIPSRPMPTDSMIPLPKLNSTRLSESDFGLRRNSAVFIPA